MDETEVSQTSQISETHPRVAIVAPCFNEQEVIREFYAELVAVLESLPEYDFCIWFVDDGSQDATLDILRELATTDRRVRVLVLSRNFGHQIALTAGLDHAEAEAVITLDSDLQHPPELIPELIARWQAGAEVVSTVREATQNAGLFKRMSSRLFYQILNALSETQIPAGTADFQLLSGGAFEALRAMPERHRFVRGMVSWIGYRREFVTYTARERFAGRSKYSLARMVKLALHATLSFSTVPLSIATRIGILTAFLGFVYLGYAIGRYLLIGDLVPGWASVLGTILILSGTQLLFTGILGQYVAMIFEESKRRPLYFVARRFGAESDDGSRGSRLGDSPTCPEK